MVDWILTFAFAAYHLVRTRAQKLLALYNFNSPLGLNGSGRRPLTTSEML